MCAAPNKAPIDNPKATKSATGFNPASPAAAASAAAAAVSSPPASASVVPAVFAVRSATCAPLPSQSLVKSAILESASPLCEIFLGVCKELSSKSAPSPVPASLAS